MGKDHGSQKLVESTNVLNFSASDMPVSLDRHELQVILNLYGRKVALGEWRDYAIDFSRHQAVFAIYRRSSEYPLYKIVKDPKLARKQGMYAVIAQSGQILKRGTDLARVIAVLDKPVRLVEG